MLHGDDVISAEFSPDGQRVVTASNDGTARLWDTLNGKPIGKPMQHGRWKTGHGARARLADPQGWVRSAQFSPDGQRVVTVTYWKTARLWDALSGKPIGEPMQHEEEVRSAQFSPDGQRVVSVSAETARLRDALSGKPIGEPMRHGDSVYSAQFSPDGQRVVTASADGAARLWDVPTISCKDTTEDVLLLAGLAEASCGFTLQPSGETEILAALTPEQVAATRKQIAEKFAGQPSSALTPLQRFLKWSVSEGRSRTISPFSELPVAEWVENRINEATIDGLRAAIRVDPANVRLAAHFGRSLADYALKKGTDVDETRRTRAEADYQTQRAVKLAPDNNEVKKLRAEVVQLLQINSD
jgi:dipeptidyl aminopeptidase/acylaminoacyl peptidase